MKRIPILTFVSFLGMIAPSTGSEIDYRIMLGATEGGAGEAVVSQVPA